MKNDRMIEAPLDPPDPPKIPECPVCRSDLYEQIYRDCNGDICGCSECMEVLSVGEYLQELEWLMEDERYSYEEMRNADP